MSDKRRTCTNCENPLHERMFAFTDIPVVGGFERRFDKWCQDCRSAEQTHRHLMKPPVSRPTPRGERARRNVRSRAATTANRQLRFRYPQRHETFSQDAARLYPFPAGADADERKHVTAKRARRVAMWMRAEYTREYEQLFQQAKLDEQPPGRGA